MARRGPKPKTAANSRRRSSATEADSRWAPPAHLRAPKGKKTNHAAEAWRRMVELLREAGNLDRTDPVMVEVYAINVSLLREAQASIAADGVMIKNRFGVKVPNPATELVNSATLRIKAIINDLGLCPATSKYSASQSDAGKNQENTKWGDLLGVAG
jgi:P27 family predicted phage terminase small subunit